MEDDFVLVDEPPPPLEEVGPSNPLETSPPSDPPEGSEMDRLVQRFADLQVNGDVAATRLSATEERLRFSEQRAQFLEEGKRPPPPAQRPPHRLQTFDTSQSSDERSTEDSSF